MKPECESVDLDEHDVYLPTDKDAVNVEKVTARNCPTSPRLFLSDGLEKYSVFAYRIVGSGLEKIDRVLNLHLLGYSESASGTSDIR